MKTRNIAMMAVVIAFVMAACEPSPRMTRKDRSTGGTAEILVITQNIDQWNGTIGDSIKHFFLDYQYGLPQPEAQNDLMHVNKKDFSDLFQKHNCILEVEIDPALKKPKPRLLSTYGPHRSVM